MHATAAVAVKHKRAHTPDPKARGIDRDGGLPLLLCVLLRAFTGTLMLENSGIAHPGVRPRFTRVLREQVQVNQVLPGSKFFLSRG